MANYLAMLSLQEAHFAFIVTLKIENHNRSFEKWKDNVRGQQQREFFIYLSTMCLSVSK